MTTAMTDSGSVRQPKVVEFDVEFHPDDRLWPRRFTAFVLDYGRSGITSVVFRPDDPGGNESGHRLGEGLCAYAYDVDVAPKATIKEALDIAIGFLERDVRE
jgi:hypothetical protein